MFVRIPCMSVRGTLVRGMIDIIWRKYVHRYALHIRTSLASWVESPTIGCHIFLVPRILQRDFGHLSKFITFGGQYTDLPLPFTPLVPFILYFIPPFDRSIIYQRQLISPVNEAPNPLPDWAQHDINGLLLLSASSGHC